MINEIVANITLFIFVFSVLAMVRLGVNFVSSLLSDPPQPLNLSNQEIILHGIFLSYIISYIIVLL